MKMRQKISRRVALSLDDAVAIVRAYHVYNELQRDIARRYGASQSQISRIVHGDSWPEAYQIVEREQAEATS